MPKLFGIHIPFSRHPQYGSHMGTPDQLLGTQTAQHMKEMFDGAPGPHLHELLKQANLVEQEALKAHHQQLLQKIAKKLAHQAKAARAAAEALPDVAAKTAGAAEKLLGEVESLPLEHTQSPFSNLATLATTACKAMPGKLFMLIALPIFAYWYNHDCKLTNLRFNIKVGQKKIVQIKYRSHNVTKCFEFVVAPGETLYAPKKLSQPDRSPPNSHPSTTDSTGFFINYLAAPLTGYLLPRTTEKKIYHIVIEDPTSNPFLANGPLVHAFPVSADDNEIVRITHKSTYDCGHPTQAAPPFAAAANEAIKTGAATDWDNIRHINAEIEDPPSDEELVQHCQLSSHESLTITQKLLP